MSKTKRHNPRRAQQPPAYALTFCRECSAKARCHNRGGGYLCATCEHDEVQTMRSEAFAPSVI